MKKTFLIIFLFISTFSFAQPIANFSVIGSSTNEKGENIIFVNKVPCTIQVADSSIGDIVEWKWIFSNLIYDSLTYTSFKSVININRPACSVYGIGLTVTDINGYTSEAWECITIELNNNDIATSIPTVKENFTVQPFQIFNLQGQLITDYNNAPSGIYFFLDKGQTKKVLKFTNN